MSKETKSESGALGNLKRWNNDLYLDVLNKKTTLENAIIVAKGRTAIKNIANIAVNVNDTVTVTVNDIKKEKGARLVAPFFSMYEFKNRLLFPGHQHLVYYISNAVA